MQRICGVCPVSHMHSASIAAEQALGITIPNNARIIRNLVEGAQFLHSHILWLYNLAGLDYVNPLNALGADAADAYDLAAELGTPSADFVGLQDRLKKFADNGQLSIFSGNWFDTGEYNMTPEADLILTAHYLEALQMQSNISEIAALLGGKMPHIMTIVPGGTAFVPTAEKLDDLKGLVDEVYQWVADTMIPDIAGHCEVLSRGYHVRQGHWPLCCLGRVLRARSTRALPTPHRMRNRYLVAGVLDENFNISDPDESKITEYVGHSWYEGHADSAAVRAGHQARDLRVRRQRSLHLGQVPALRWQVSRDRLVRSCARRL